MLLASLLHVIVNIHDVNIVLATAGMVSLLELSYLHAVASFTTFVSVPALPRDPTVLTVIFLFSFLPAVAWIFVVVGAIIILLSSLLLLVAGVNAVACTIAVLACQL
jgi:hypothetical protein